MLKDRLNQLKEYVYDSSISLKDRSFVVFSFVLIGELIFGAIPSGIIMKEPWTSTLSTMAGVFFFGAYVAYAIKKNKIASAKIIISCILIFLFLPLMFFTNGGVYSGVPVSLLLGGLYINMIMDGKPQVVMNILYSLTMIICWIVGYYNPDLITSYTRKGAFIDSIFGLLIVNAVIFILLSFHTKLYEKENERATEKSKELEELNRSQNRFFSSMSHEIRTPINTVLGLNEIILRQEDASDEIRKDARNIQGAGKMLLALINDILDVSKIEAGKMDIVPVNYDVSSLLSEIVNMIWLKAEEKGLKFNVDIDPNVPESMFGDEVRIKQILINLLNNAVKYTQEGSVSLHMECEYPETDNVLLKITVTDTGMGIKAEALPHLFDTFKRVDEEKNRYIEGTGLGLSIVKQLVELMDGQITVNSVYSQGSTFTVMLKQGISSDKRIGDLNISNAAGVAGNEKFEHMFKAPDARILIVDDNEMNLKVEEKLLDGTKIKVDLALSGKDALNLTLRNRYDVIFMDHLMPQMDGVECFEQIREQKGGLNRNIPIIVLTANAGGENIELYNNTGFDGYLVKPVSGRQLEDMLIAHLPQEKVTLNSKGESSGAQLSTASRYTKKKPVVIATSTMSDLPASVIKELQIDIIPYTVITNEGVFYDNIDIDSEELVRYMSDMSKMVDSEPPTEEALTAFFTDELKKAHHLIYITLTTGSSREYGRAVNVAKTFDNVTVFNSECLSSATGILVMIAARLAEQGMSVDKIVSELDVARDYIRCSFVVKSTDVMARRDRISPFMNNLLQTLWLRPMLRMKNDKLGVGRFLFGSEKRCYEKYIDYALPINVYPDTSFAFITYAGVPEEELVWIEQKLNERMKFDHIIFQKASAGISSNCGEGTFGILYLIKGNRNYNLGSVFAKVSADRAEFADEEYEDKEYEYDDQPLTDTEVHEESALSGDASQEAEWYDGLPGIDSKVAIKNSGSKEAFLSVLKIYYDTYEAKSTEIQKYYDEKDWENYTIKVHALKSSSRLVGAVALGDAAEALEVAGNKRDIEYIESHHAALMESYLNVRDALDDQYGVKDDLPDIPSDVLNDAYGGLLEFTESMDYELAKMVVDSVKEYRLPSEDAERFKKIQICLSQLDWDGIKVLIHDIM
ncbi:MAG: DegV family EDD domain-containing protein [Lachnospiraceae bacterium]|nr:DegV family EDD domain-containing protein [Lachnospiraceae bacterium]